MTTLNGHFEPNAPGARTLRDAKPLYIGHERVTAEVYYGRRLSVFIGLRMVHDEMLPDEITGYHQINPYVRDIALAESR